MARESFPLERTRKKDDAKKLVQRGRYNLKQRTVDTSKPLQVMRKRNFVRQQQEASSPRSLSSPPPPPPPPAISSPQSYAGTSAAAPSSASARDQKENEKDPMPLDEFTVKLMREHVEDILQSAAAAKGGAKTVTLSDVAKRIASRDDIVDVFANDIVSNTTTASVRRESFWRGDSKNIRVVLDDRTTSTRRQSRRVGPFLSRLVQSFSNRDRQANALIMKRKYDFLIGLQMKKLSEEQRATIVTSWHDVVQLLQREFEFPAVQEHQRETGDLGGEDNHSIAEDFQKQFAKLTVERNELTTTTRPSKNEWRVVAGEALRQFHEDQQLRIEQQQQQQQNAKRTSPTTVMGQQQVQDRRAALDEADILLEKRLEQFQQEIDAKSPSKLASLRMEERLVEKEELERKQAQEAKERASLLMRPMSEEEQARVRKALYEVGPPNQVVAQDGSDMCLRESLQRLRPQEWLNDEVIHYFLLMLAKRDEEQTSAAAALTKRRRSHFFKSFFMTKLLNEGNADPALNGRYDYKQVKRWSKNVPGKDLFNLDKIFFPINQGGMHWVCAVAYMQEKRIQFYDSMGDDGIHYLEAIFQYLQDEHVDKKKAPLPDKDKWTLVPCTSDTPRQWNGFDCGVFTCMFIDFLAKDCPLVFNQEHVTQCRERIALSILNGKAIL